MYSEYLKEEIELTEKNATLEGGRKQTIVLHAELEDFIINRLRGKVRYDFPTVIPGKDAVVVCRMRDVTGNGYVSAIGEATENTRNSGVADAYPTTTAANRAFDRAAIKFLGLGRVYSNLEIAPDGPKRYDSEKLNDAPTNSTAENAQVDEPKTAVQKPVKPEQKPVVQAPTKAEVKPTPPSQEISTQKESSHEQDSDGAVLITIGKYSGHGKTIAEIYESEPQWLEYVANNLKPKKDDVKNQWESIKRYLAAQEAK